MNTSRRLTVTAGMAAVLVLLTVAGPWLTPYDANAQLDIIALRSQAPSLAHPFGTDGVGRDVLSRVLDGARISLLLATLSVVLSLIVGTLYGALSTLAGGSVHAAMQRLIDVALAIPRLLLLLAIAALWGALSLPALILLVGLTGWFATARLVADDLAALRGREFTVAARALGVRPVRLLWRHLFPHLLPTLAINASFGVAGTIALEAGLSYLGLGIQPPQASWGTILRDGSGVMQTEWWLTLFPGLATVFAVLACNALGDALRERFAPAHVPSRSAPPLPRAVRP
jgi:peptide/nickel transport system permease protein